MKPIKNLIELVDKKFDNKKDKANCIKSYILKTYNNINTIENPAILANSIPLIRYVIENDTWLKDEEYTKFHDIVRDCCYKIEDQANSLRRDIDKCVQTIINSIVENNKSDYEDFRKQFVKIMSEDNIKRAYAKYKGIL